MYRNERNYENLNKAIYEGTGQYDIPILLPESKIVTSFIGFNAVGNCKYPEKTGVHFFIDDYQFLRLWRNPDAYLNMLGAFDAVCTPDFSIYADFPKAVQIFNHYRKHWLGAYWQNNGITVIPTISWSDKSSFEWCFDGEPEGGAAAVSSIATQKNPESRRLFMEGYNEMLARLQPSIIYFYGNIPDGCKGNIIHIPAFQEKFRCKPSEEVI